MRIIDRQTLIGIALIILIGMTTNGFAQPVISRIEPPVITLGQKNSIKIYGSNLTQVQSWVTTCPLKFELDKSAKSSATVQHLIVTGDRSECAGINLLRGVGKNVATNYFPVATDAVPNRTIAPDKPVDVSRTTPVLSFSGKLSGQQKVILNFTAKKNELIKFEVESVRLGSKLRPALFLMNLKDSQMAWSQPQSRYGGDTYLGLRAPNSGKYRLVLQDQLSKAPAGSVFRIKLGDVDSSVQVFPVAKTHRKPQLLKSKSIADTPPVAGGWQPTLVQKDSLFSGWRPSVISRLRLELDELKLPRQKMTFPMAINGVITKPGERDVYDIRLPGDRKFLTVKVYAAQLRSPLDAVIVVRGDKNQILGQMDDTPNSIDPTVNVNLPAKSKTVSVEISDLLGRGGENFCYRIVLSDEQSPPFQINLDSDHLAIAPGETKSIRVQATRGRYRGPIEIHCKFPGNLNAAKTTIPAGNDSAFLTIRSDGQTIAGFVNIYGSIPGHAYTTRAVTPKPAINVRQQPIWMNSLVTVGTSDLPDFAMRLGPLQKSKYFDYLYTAKITVERRKKFDNKIRLSYLTNQKIKMVKQKNKQVPDPKSTVRLLGAGPELEIAKGQTEKTLFFFCPKPQSATQLLLTGRKLKLKPDAKNPFDNSPASTTEIVTFPK